MPGCRRPGLRSSGTRQMAVRGDRVWQRQALDGGGRLRRPPEQARTSAAAVARQWYDRRQSRHDRRRAEFRRCVSLSAVIHASDKEQGPRLHRRPAPGRLGSDRSSACTPEHRALDRRHLRCWRTLHRRRRSTKSGGDELVSSSPPITPVGASSSNKIRRAGGRGAQAGRVLGASCAIRFTQYDRTFQLLPDLRPGPIVRRQSASALPTPARDTTTCHQAGRRIRHCRRRPAKFVGAAALHQRRAWRSAWKAAHGL